MPSLTNLCAGGNGMSKRIWNASAVQIATLTDQGSWKEGKMAHFIEV